MTQPKPKKPAGRPPKMEDGKRRNIYIDEASWQKAMRLGNGKPSEGIRKALSYIPELPPAA